MTITKNLVLDTEVIRRKIKRMALEVAEQNWDEKELIIAGIAGNGEVVAKALIKELEKLALHKTTFITIQLNKKDPLRVSLNTSIDFNDKVVLIVDDVANTGRTILYALKPFLEQYPKKFKPLF